MQFMDVFKERFMTLSNGLSVLRILLLPVFVYYCYLYHLSPAEANLLIIVLFIIVVASLSDFLDGFLARRWHQETRLGQYLDPVADKLTSLISLFILYLYFDMPLWIWLVVLTREIFGVWMGTYLYFKRNMQGRPNVWGKIGVFLIALLVLWYVLTPYLGTMLDNPGNWLLHPEFLAYVLVLVLMLGMVVYTATYWQVVWHPDRAGDISSNRNT